MKIHFLLALAALGSVVLLPRVASANPRLLPFTYGADTLAEGEAEIENYVDFVPIRALSASSGKKTWYGQSVFQTEIEYGLLPRLELGLYLTFTPSAGDSFAQVAIPSEGNGIKQRLKFALAEPGAWPIDVALYGELVQNQREFEIEAKLILERRFGPVRVLLNGTGEREYYYSGQKDWVLRPSAGVGVEVTPKFQPGIETFVRSEYTSPAINPRPFDLGPHVYVGPTILGQFGKVWWGAGAYVRASDRSHVLAPAEAYGNFWFRSVIGIEL